MNTQPEALRLADFLERNYDFYPSSEQMNAAAELRRLHQSEREGWRHADELEQERKRLHKANQAMLEELKNAATSLETIGRLSGKAYYMGDDGEKIQTFMQYPDEIRGYANSRASVTRAAIAKGELK